MELSELQLLTFIITRTSMFVGSDERTHIVAFFSGYEIGKETKVLDKISQKLEQKYECPKRAMGWNGQVEMLANNFGLTWESAFKKIMLEQIIENKTIEESSKIEELIKSFIETRISQFQLNIGGSNKGVRQIDIAIVRTWIAIVDLEKDWFKNLWSKKQLEIIDKINLEIVNMYSGIEKEKFIPTENLIELSIEFDNEKAST